MKSEGNLKKFKQIISGINLSALIIFSCSAFSEENCESDQDQDQDVVRCYFHSSPYLYKSKAKKPDKEPLTLPTTANIYNDDPKSRPLLIRIFTHLDTLTKSHKQAQIPKLYNPHFPGLIMKKSYNFENSQDKKVSEFFNIMEFLPPTSELSGQLNELNPDSDLFLSFSVGIYELWPSVKKQDSNLSSLLFSTLDGNNEFRLEPGSIPQFGFDADWEYLGLGDGLDSYEVLGVAGILFDRSGKIITSGFEGFKVGSTNDYNPHLHLGLRDEAILPVEQGRVITDQDLEQLLEECKDISQCPMDMAYNRLIMELGIQ